MIKFATSSYRDTRTQREDERERESRQRACARSREEFPRAKFRPLLGAKWRLLLRLGSFFFATNCVQDPYELEEERARVSYLEGGERVCITYRGVAVRRASNRAVGGKLDIGVFGASGEAIFTRRSLEEGEQWLLLLLLLLVLWVQSWRLGGELVRCDLWALLRAGRFLNLGNYFGRKGF